METQEIRELRNIRERLERIQEDLEEVRVRLARLTGEAESFEIPPEWMQPRLRVWHEIHQKGGIVPLEELHKIAGKIGYDLRGLGGFFGGNEPSLTRIAGGKVALTESAVKKVERYKDWLEHRGPSRGEVITTARC